MGQPYYGAYQQPAAPMQPAGAPLFSNPWQPPAAPGGSAFWPAGGMPGASPVPSPVPSRQLPVPQAHQQAPPAGWQAQSAAPAAPSMASSAAPTGTAGLTEYSEQDTSVSYYDDNAPTELTAPGTDDPGTARGWVVDAFDQLGGHFRNMMGTHSVNPTGAGATPRVHHTTAGTADSEESVHMKLRAALTAGDALSLQAAVMAAHGQGMHGEDVRAARDMLLRLEVRTRQQHAHSAFDDAIASDDYWKMQAAMIHLISSGQDIVKLQEAMRTCKRRQDATHQCRRAFANRSEEALRTGIEAALKSHVKEEDVRKAREDLRTLEGWAAVRPQLSQAMGKDSITLQSALQAGERAKFVDEADLQLLKKLRSELRDAKIGRIRAMQAEGDVSGLEAALQEAQALGFDDDEVKGYVSKYADLRTKMRHREALRTAVSSGDRSLITSAVRAAEADGLNEGDLTAARTMLRSFEEQDAAQAKRTEALKELQVASQAENAGRMERALTVAEELGLNTPEVVAARDQLRNLRYLSGAEQDLQDAVQAGDKYRLRAALATARGTAGVRPERLQAAQRALKALEGKDEAKRALDGAIARRDAQLLCEAIAQAKHAGLDRGDISAAEAKLGTLQASGVVQELQQAIDSDDVVRLRAAGKAANDAGITGLEVDRVWDRVRMLDSQAWLTRQLRAAIASGEFAKLQSAVRQAEESASANAGPNAFSLAPGPAEFRRTLDEARAELRKSCARRDAMQELQLARAGGRPEAVAAAVRAAELAGVSATELAGAREELGMQGGSYPAATLPKSGGAGAGGRSVSREKRSVRFGA